MNKCIQKFKINKLTQSEPIKGFIDDQIIIEQPMNLNVNNTQEFTLLCSPENFKELVIGFLYTQQIINSVIDITDFSVTKNQIMVTTKPTTTTKPKTNPIQISSPTLFKVMDELHTKQQLFKKTGGSHAAGIFNSQGEILTFAEDVARHNAFDKAIGMGLLNNINLHNCGAVLSSRVSYEMINKAVQAGLQIVVAVSAPTSLAIKIADQNKITLCGFVRGKNANIYTHIKKIKIPSENL